MKRLAIGCAVLVTAFVVLLIVISLMPASMMPTQSALEGGLNTRRAPSRPIGDKIEARTLIAEYANNSVAADAKFKGRWLEITGTITDIGTDILGSPYVTLHRRIDAVQAMFTRNRDERLVGSFSKGQEITITCRGDGKLLNVLVRDCFVP